MSAYYNEHDKYAAQWLRNLIAAGHIADGVVDERDIRDITPDELRGFTQCHFFAGIGVWSRALRTAGWSDDRPVWTGSCPCQPFSAAGRRAGTSDERHLWPHWFHLIEQCRPPIVFGEQVASKDGLGWLDLVSADLEGTGYATGASDLCAAGFGGAHIRQRLYFVGVGHSKTARRQYEPNVVGGIRKGVDQAEREPIKSAVAGSDIGLVDADNAGPQEHGQSGSVYFREPNGSGAGRQHLDASLSGGLADTDGGDTCAERKQRGGKHRQQQGDSGGCQGAGTANAPMLGRHPVDWLFCRDGKWRPVEPGTFPLAHAAPARVGRLRAYGNALDAETASNFVSAAMEAQGFGLC